MSRKEAITAMLEDARNGIMKDPYQAHPHMPYSETGIDFPAGIPFDLRSHVVMIFAKLYALVGDGDALMHIIHCKDSGGFKMCLCCDVCDHAANLRIGYTPSTCLDESRLVYMNDEAVPGIMSEIADLEACDR